MQNKKMFGVGDTLVMKKNHACSKNAKEFKIIRVGSDIRMVCLFCSHDVTIPRIKLEKNIKSVIYATQNDGTETK